MQSASYRPIALVIVDGWSAPDPSRPDAVATAFTPNLDEIKSRFPSTTLAASGSSVGLPDGAPGNPEIGHMNIGAGRVLRSDAARVAGAIANGEFFNNPVLKAAMSKAVGSKLHLIGLLSDGDVHSSSETLYALLRMAKNSGVGEAFVHGVLDGRDVPARTADVYVEALEVKMQDIGLGKVASLCGRFFAMDSDENWERTARAFTMLAFGEGERFSDTGTAIRGSFLRGISDEFIAPIVIEQRSDVPVATVDDGDVVIFFNHRADTMKQLVRSLAVSGETGKARIDAVCLTEYDPAFDLPVAFPPERSASSVAAMLNEHGRNNYRIGDADRFAHVTDFFNCGTESSGDTEYRIPLARRSGEAAPAEPEMYSFKTTDRLLRAIETDTNGVFIVNLPAADLMAGNGDFDRTVEAVQYIDTCLGGIVDKIRAVGGVAMITSTHANSEIFGDGPTDNQSKTAENVPFYLIDESASGTTLRSGGSLHDVGATLLAVAGIDIPAEMTGRDLRIA